MRRGRYVKGKKVGKGPLVDAVGGPTSAVWLVLSPVPLLPV